MSRLVQQCKQSYKPYGSLQERCDYSTSTVAPPGVLSLQSRFGVFCVLISVLADSLNQYLFYVQLHCSPCWCRRYFAGFQRLVTVCFYSAAYMNALTYLRYDTIDSLPKHTLHDVPDVHDARCSRPGDSRFSVILWSRNNILSWHVHYDVWIYRCTNNAQNPTFAFRKYSVWAALRWDGQTYSHLRYVKFVRDVSCQ